MLYSSITSYHFQQFWCLSRLLFVTKYYQQHFSQHRRQAKCTAVPLQIVEFSQPRYVVVDRYQKHNTFVKSPKQN